MFFKLIVKTIRFLRVYVICQFRVKCEIIRTEMLKMLKWESDCVLNH